MNYLVCIDAYNQCSGQIVVGITNNDKLGLFEILHNLTKMRLRHYEYFTQSFNSNKYIYDDSYNDTINIYKIFTRKYNYLQKFYVKYEENITKFIDKIKYVPEDNYSSFWYFTFDDDGDVCDFDKKFYNKIERIMNKSKHVL